MLVKGINGGRKEKKKKKRSIQRKKMCVEGALFVVDTLKSGVVVVKVQM